MHGGLDAWLVIVLDKTACQQRLGYWRTNSISVGPEDAGNAAKEIGLHYHAAPPASSSGRCAGSPKLTACAGQRSILLVSNNTILQW